MCMWNLVSHSKGRAQIVFKNRLLKTIFQHKREDVTGDRGKLYECSEDLHILYSLPNVIIVSII
jgi:hypothetical protein